MSNSDSVMQDEELRVLLNKWSHAEALVFWINA